MRCFRPAAALLSLAFAIGAQGADCRNDCLVQLHNCLTNGKSSADQCQTEYAACTGRCPAR